MKTNLKKLGYILGMITLSTVINACDSSNNSGSGASSSSDTSSSTISVASSRSVSAAVADSSVISSPSPSPSPSASPVTYSGGSGAAGDPYQLETAQDIVNIAQNPSSYFTVVQDIDMSSVTYTPIDNFSGTIYGNNHHLYNLTITTTGTNNAALFIQMSGTIVSLVLQNITVTSAHYAAGFAYNVTGSITSCGVSGTMTSALGGNGFNTGVGNSIYTTQSGSSVIGTTQNTMFNGNHVTATL